MIVRKLRLQRGWSQDQLARLSGLSTRTIQRIERGHNAGLESWKSLAAVFELDINDLQQEFSMNSDTGISNEEQAALEYVRDIKGFYTHLATYVFSVGALLIANYAVFPEYIWAHWVALGWGIGIAAHGVGVFEVFNFFGPEWERRQVEKRLGKKL